MKLKANLVVIVFLLWSASVVAHPASGIVRDRAGNIYFSDLETIWKIALPNSQPDILAGMRIGLTVALILTVIGEMLTSENGLGYHILMAARAFRSADLFAGVILLGLIGLTSNVILQEIERYMLRWKRR